MVYVDFSHPILRDRLRVFCAEHERALLDVCDHLAGWVADSREFEAQRAAALGVAPRPLAATLDLDEVILGNIHMNMYVAPAGSGEPDFHAADHFTGPDGQPWPRGDLRLNPLLPGARALLEALAGLGLRVYIVTGRLESLRAETVENLEYVGLAGAAAAAPLFRSDELAAPGEWPPPPGGPGPLVMCPDAENPAPGQSIRPYKESRRRAIEETHRIVLNLGDQVSDLGHYGDIQAHCSHPFYWCA